MPQELNINGRRGPSISPLRNLRARPVSLPHCIQTRTRADVDPVVKLAATV